MLRPPAPRRSDSSESRATSTTQSSQQISFHPSTKHVRTASSAPTTPFSFNEKHELARFASRHSIGSPLTRVRTRTDSSCLWENFSNSSERGDGMDEDNFLYHDRFVILTRTHLIVTHLLFLNVSIPLSSVRSARPLVTDAEVVKLSTRPKGQRRPPHGVTTGGFGWTGTLWARDLRRLRDETWLKNAVVLDDVAGWLGKIAFSVEQPNQWWAAWAALGLAMLVTYLSAYNASANGAASAGFRKEHPSVSASVFQASSFTYLAMLGIGPLVLAPVSEATGRRPQIVICTFVIAVLFLGQALAPNVYSLIFCRLVKEQPRPTAAGVVADLWPKRTRGPAMGLFVLTVFTANATGPLCSNWIAQTVGWRWAYWVQLISTSVCFVLCLFLFPEPRADVILGKRCKKLQEESGRPHLVEGLEGTESMLDAVKLSLTRPLLYLFTEPIVASLALWVGFAWGVVFLLVGSIAHVFEKTYGFSQGQGGTVLICGFIGAFVSYILHLTVQEPLYRKALMKGNGKAKPEARLYSAAIGGILFSAGFYTIYFGTYLVLGDIYDRYSSSAQAAQSLLRNILGATFPFFGVAMYDRLTFPWASTLVGFIAGAFAILTGLSLADGERLRARSKVAISMEQQEGDVLGEEPAPAHLTEVEMP
ncbi:hypothetical protein JCM10296v2_001750 [Rhodotorula toruloides]